LADITKEKKNTKGQSKAKQTNKQTKHLDFFSYDITGTATVNNRPLAS